MISGLVVDFWVDVVNDNKELIQQMCVRNEVKVWNVFFKKKKCLPSLV